MPHTTHIIKTHQIPNTVFVIKQGTPFDASNGNIEGSAHCAVTMKISVKHSVLVWLVISNGVLKISLFIYAIRVDRSEPNRNR